MATEQEVKDYVINFMDEKFYLPNDDSFRAFKCDFDYAEFINEFIEHFSLEDIGDFFFDPETYNEFMELCVDLVLNPRHVEKKEKEKLLDEDECIALENEPEIEQEVEIDFDEHKWKLEILELFKKHNYFTSKNYDTWTSTDDAFNFFEEFSDKYDLLWISTVDDIHDFSCAHDLHESLKILLDIIKRKLQHDAKQKK